jgi:hypothetical protein
MHLIHTGRSPHSSVKLCSLFLTMSVVQVFVPLQLHGTFYQDRDLRTVFGERAFPFSVPKAWNVLPDRFHSIESTDPFKKQLKTVLFNHSASSRYFVFIIVFFLSKRR